MKNFNEFTNLCIQGINLSNLHSMADLVEILGAPTDIGCAKTAQKL